MDYNDNEQNRMAPPPPPLPEGMTVIQAGVGRQADVAVKKTKGPRELPPPPIPMEMLKKAREEAATVAAHSVPVQPQPEMQSKPERETPLPVRGGRPTMSLSAAVSQKEEAERKAAEEAAKPCVNANGGKLDVGDGCYARSGMDGLYYYARIEQFDSEKAGLIFFDEAAETILFEKIYTVEKAAEDMQCFANWNSQGNYYPAKIKSVLEDKFLVSYDENPDLTEELSFDLIRFALW